MSESVFEHKRLVERKKLHCFPDPMFKITRACNIDSIRATRLLSRKEKPLEVQLSAAGDCRSIGCSTAGAYS
eukprot:2732682-Amphidinium_carterae.1